jgi:oligopeptide/dipeptide ABC transporter ATP-binding protein
MSGAILSVRALSKTFRLRSGPALFSREVSVPAVRGVSFDVAPASTFALVGESGSGKSTTARLILRLVEPDGGSVTLAGADWLGLPRHELNRRRRDVGVVFQDPATSLDPRLSVGRIVSEPLDVHGMGSRAERRERVQSLLSAVGLPPAFAGRVARELSGGQRQRVGIARALATEPRFVVLDEPVSALDVSVRAQILNLLLDLQESTPSRPAYLFIGHDLAVVRQVAARTGVMYLGRLVEEGPTEELFRSPRHPYTSLLLASQPRREPGPDRAGSGAASAAGAPSEPASPSRAPAGCAFHPRCPSAKPRCKEQVPPEEVVGEDGHRAACFFPNDPRPD